MNMTRRQFIKTAGLASLAIGTATALSGCIELEESEKEKNIKEATLTKIERAELQKRIFYISLQEYAAMNGKNITDYEIAPVEGISGRKSQREYDLALNEAFKKIVLDLDSKGLEVAVGIRHDISERDYVSWDNRVLVYGTGIKLKKK